MREYLIHKSASYIAEINKKYKNGNAELTIVNAPYQQEWQRHLPFRIHAKNIDKYFDKIEIKEV